VSLTLEEARARAVLLHDVSYVLDLDITDGETFGVRAEVTFSCREPGAETFLELAHAQQLTVDGREPDYDGNRIRLTDLQEQQTIVVEARLPYVTDGDGMHTFTDPADGEVYRSAYCSIDIAHLVYPCFDQNDLKARITLRVAAPEDWTVLANSRVAHHETADGQGRWEFAPTPPLPPAMFAMCGGPWASVTWEHAGLPFGWHARKSLGAQLERDADDLRRVTEACFDHYAEIFDEPFPFDSYDQAMVPGHNWGAMETPGCVTYRDEMLPLSAPTQPERRTRSMVIAHEMAHMWFGDLVTMTWWEDTWLQESFADYLGFRVAQEAGIQAPWVDFTIGRKPFAYLADARRSTHPVAPLAEDVPDVDAASGNFDALSYAKGNSCLRQLVTWIGEDAFYGGVNAYLTRHRWGNTTLDDFVGALDEATPDRDVRGWAAAWLRSTGFDTIGATREGDEVVLTRTGSRPHRLRVTSYDAGWAELDSVLVDLADAPVRVPAAAALVLNAHGETYARVRLDDESWSRVAAGLSEVPDPDARAVLWATAVDLAWAGELPMDAFVDLVERHLPAETHPAVVQFVPMWAGTKLLTTLAAPDAVTSILGRLAETYASALAREPHPDVAVVLTRHLASVDHDADRLRAAAASHDASLRWTALRRLAALGALDAAEIERERAADATIVADLGAARALAARPDPSAKAQAWARIVEDATVSNREVQALAQGLWDPERVDLVAPYVDRYLAESPRLAVARGSAFAELIGKHGFPTVPFTDAQVSALRTALEGDLPTILRRGWEDALDDLVRPGRRTSS
jgi:aminopeptidase N